MHVQPFGPVQLSFGCGDAVVTLGTVLLIFLRCVYAALVRLLTASCIVAILASVSTVVNQPIVAAVVGIVVVTTQLPRLGH